MKEMPKYIVKKPMTVFVLAVIIIALGIVSVTGMTPDLLPNIDLPYVVIMTVSVSRRKSVSSTRLKSSA